MRQLVFLSQWPRHQGSNRIIYRCLPLNQRRNRSNNRRINMLLYSEVGSDMRRGRAFRQSL